MMNKLMEAQQKMEEQKKMNENIVDEVKSNDGHIFIKINANRVIKDLQINESVLQDKEMLEDMLLATINKAIEIADKRHEEQMAGLAKGMIPGMGF